MGLKIVINNSITKLKENKKEIVLLGILIGILIWAITSLVLSPLVGYIWLNYGPRPDIISNVVLYKSANFSDCCTHMTDFFFLYYIGDEWSTLLFLNASDKENAEQYGIVVSPNFQICEDCAIYSFTMKNIGNKKADKIVIDIKSSSVPEIIIDNPKMTKKECGGHFDSKGCYIVLENINENEEINFVLSMRESQDFIITSCYADEIYACNFQFIKFLSQTINPKKDILEMNDIKVIFPTLENSPPNTLYYFDPNEFDETKSVWVSIPSVHETSKI